MRRFFLAPGLVLTGCILIYLGYWRILTYFMLLAICHEISHCIVLLIFRVPIIGIIAGAGETVLKTGFLSPGQGIAAAAAGPAVNALLAVALWRFAPLAAFISAFLCCYNLLPIWPLDGGRILYNTLLLRSEERKCRRITHIAATITGIAVMFFAVWLSISLQYGVLPWACVGIVLLRLHKIGIAEGF